MTSYLKVLLCAALHIRRISTFLYRDKSLFRPLRLQKCEMTVYFFVAKNGFWVLNVVVRRS